MRTLAIAALVAGTLCSVTGPASATHVATGSTCAFRAATDPTGAPGTFAGVMDSGQVTATSASPTVVTVVCTIQVDANSLHADVDSAAAAATGTQAAAIPTTLVSYVASTTPAVVYLCTEWTVGSTTYYYDAATATFSTSNQVHCVPAVVTPLPGAEGHVVQSVAADI